MLGAVEFAEGFFFARFETRDARGFFKDLPTLGGVGFQHPRDLALLDDGVGVGAHAGVHEQLFDVAQPGPLVVDEVFAGAVAVELAGDGDLIGVDRQGTRRTGRASRDGDRIAIGVVALSRVGFGGIGGLSGLGHRGHRGNLDRLLCWNDWVVEGQGHRGHARGLALGAAVEDDVEHRAAAEALGALIAQHPLDGVHDVGLAAAVGPDDADDGLVEGDLGLVGERLEAGEGELG